ncbi:MAG: TolC family protein, partial [Flavobacteriaceae bacterium]|nr:TolC family protein [Flavobacteriaceae bacterium]
YSNVILTEKTIEILENNKAVLQKNLNETLKIYENGLTEEESVEQLQITLANIESSLLNAQRLKLIAYQMFNISLGLDLNTPVIINENLEELVFKNIKLNLIEDQGEIENNVDYKIAQNDKESKELLLKLEKSKFLPSLTAFINGGYIANSDAFTFADSDQKWFGSSLFGLSMNVPVFSSFSRKASTQRAKIELDKASELLTETEEQLRLEIATAKSNYEYAIQQYQTSKQNLNLAERIELKNQTKFFEGITTSFDLRQAQMQLYGFQQEYLQAMIDVINRKADLESVLNKIEN